MLNNESFGKPRRHGFNPTSLHVRFLTQSVALGQVFVRVFLFSPVTIIPPVLHYPLKPTGYVILQQV